MYGGKFAFQSRLGLLIVGRKFAVFALFYFVYERIREQFPSKSPRGGLYSEVRFNGGFLRYSFRGPIFGGAYTWKGLFSEFYGIIDRIINLLIT